MHKNETVIFTGLSHSLFHGRSLIMNGVYNSDVADAADAATVLRYVDTARRLPNTPDQTVVDLVVAEHQVNKFSK